MQAEGQKNRLAFSKKRLEALPVPAAGRSMYHDTATPGLTLRVSAAGSKVFYLYRWADGKPVKVKLGGFPDLTVEQARGLARTKTGKQAAGDDLAAERRKARQQPTLKEAFETWRDTHAKLHRRTWEDDQRQFDKYLGEFHGRRLASIKPLDVATWHGRIGSEHGPVQANRTLTLLGTIFNWAADKLGFEGRNPVKGIKRFREQSRERFLQPQEMRAFFEAVAEEPEPWKSYFALLLFCGQRRSDTAEMRWQDIDLAGKTWRVRQTKTGRNVIVPLVPAALRILESRRETTGDSPWVFPGRAGHIAYPKKAWERMVKRAGLTDLHLHDLRRSLGSWQAALGTSLAIIGSGLGHQDVKSTMIYSRLNVEPVRQAIQQATEAMIQAANGGQNNAEEKQD